MSEFTFAPGSAADKGGRFALDPAHTLAIGDGERVGVGVDRKQKAHLVWEFGSAQTGVPVPAVASAVASGKVIPPAALVGAFSAMGTLDKLAAAVKAAQEKAAKAAGKAPA
jgi:hypothetical protein